MVSNDDGRRCRLTRYAVVVRILRDRFGHSYLVAFTADESPAVLGHSTREGALRTLRLMADAGDLVLHDRKRLTANVDGERLHVVRDRADRLGVERLGRARRYDEREAKKYASAG
jgi:hypothetical protein